MCIGDGYVNKEGLLSIQHGEKQVEYCEFKARLLRSLTGKKCKVRRIEYTNKVIKGVKIKDSVGAGFTCRHKYFRVLRNWLYKCGEKRITKKILSYLTLEALAIWYMDDGSLYIDKRCDYSKFQGMIEIHTHELLDNANEIRDFFKERFDIKCGLHKCYDTCGIRYNVRFYNKSVLKFLNLISEYVPKCMEYKIITPEKYVHERKACV